MRNHEQLRQQHLQHRVERRSTVRDPAHPRRAVDAVQPAVRAGDGLEEALAVFTRIRPRLFGIAYRMLGSATEAEDLLQDVWVRWQLCDREAVREPAAFLATTTTRLAINVLQSARARHEAYIGPWLPEPVDTGANPELAVEGDETLELAVLVLLERLAPAERAAYVLREAFGYPYRQIAEIVRTTEGNCRQLVSRARRHVAAERHVPVPSEEQRRLLEAFLTAARSGELEALEALFTEDVVSTSDGGGAVHAARIPLVGRARVAKFVRAVSEWFWDGVDVQWIEANGRPAVRLSAFGEPFAIVTIGAVREGIERLFWMMNPAKLGAALPAE